MFLFSSRSLALFPSLMHTQMKKIGHSNQTSQREGLHTRKSKQDWHTEPLVAVKNRNKSKKQRQETIRVVTKAVGWRLQYIDLCGFQCWAQPPATVKPPWKFGWAVQAGAGGDGGDGVFEGREQGAEWSRRGRNSAVGCISVSRSDGWVVALFVLCCHTALAPAWALMRGGRTAGQEHGGPPMPVICHAAVLLRQGDTWRQRGREKQQGWLRGWPPHGHPHVVQCTVYTSHSVWWGQSKFKGFDKTGLLQKISWNVSNLSNLMV